MNTKGEQMPSNNSKYTPEVRQRTVNYILGSGKSATSVAEEMGIDANTVCKWVRVIDEAISCLPIKKKKVIKQLPLKVRKNSKHG